MEDINNKTNKGTENTRKKNKVWVGDDRFVYVDVVESVMTEKDVEELFGELKKILEKLPHHEAKILINMATTSTVVASSKARKRVGKWARDLFQYPGCKKAAIYGGNIITRTVASFLLAANEMKEVKMFETREEALNWLKKP